MADDEPIHVTKTEARGGSAPKVTRYILAASLLLVVVIMAVVVASGMVAVR